MTTLKEATAEKHRIAESLPLIKSIFNGEVDKYKYTDYIYQLYFIYYTLESHSSEVGLFDGIEELKRAPRVRSDFIDLASKNYNHTVLKETNKYLNYLDSIFFDDLVNRRQRLMAHVYVRHMGDLFGGQQLAKLVPGNANMYKFDNLIGLITEVRKRIDISMAVEANIAFDFNIKIIQAYD